MTVKLITCKTSSVKLMSYWNCWDFFGKRKKEKKQIKFVALSLSCCWLLKRCQV